MNTPDAANTQFCGDCGKRIYSQRWDDACPHCGWSPDPIYEPVAVAESRSRAADHGDAGFAPGPPQINAEQKTRETFSMTQPEFTTATDALTAYRDGVISRDEARKLFGLEEDEISVESDDEDA